MTGGVGGAKLALGLAERLAPDEIAFVVNTGDDFEHLGFHISPDLDTLTYTLAGVANQTYGWGRKGETWQFIGALEALGGESWFRLGDLDLALHVRRRELLAAGAGLAEATRQIADAFGIPNTIWPMSDDPVRTVVHTVEDGELPFQHYFVRERCAPAVSGFEFRGLEQARPNPEFLQALTDCAGVIICPSNPFVSVDPILNLPGVRAALAQCSAPIVAVSPIVSGLAIKGPAAKMMSELGVPNTAAAVAAHYDGLISGFVLDAEDVDLATSVAVPTLATPSVMRTIDDKRALASAVLDFVKQLAN
ncbi:MAG: 2-phospho-L-lactate transferase [Pseudomonadota bacterium]